MTTKRSSSTTKPSSAQSRLEQRPVRPDWTVKVSSVVGGYVEFLEAIRDPKHARHAELLDWVGGSFDPDAFDASKIQFDDPQKRWKAAFDATAAGIAGAVHSSQRLTVFDDLQRRPFWQEFQRRPNQHQRQTSSNTTNMMDVPTCRLVSFVSIFIAIRAERSSYYGF